MSKLYQLKNNDDMVAFPIAEVATCNVEFGVGEEPLHTVELTMRNGRAIDVQLSSAQLESFLSRWELAL